MYLTIGGLNLYFGKKLQLNQHPLSIRIYKAFFKAGCFLVICTLINYLFDLPSVWGMAAVAFATSWVAITGLKVAHNLLNTDWREKEHDRTEE